MRSCRGKKTSESVAIAIMSDAYECKLLKVYTNSKEITMNIRRGSMPRLPFQASLSRASNFAAVGLTHKCVAEIGAKHSVTGIQILVKKAKAVLIHNGIT